MIYRVRPRRRSPPLSSQRDPPVERESIPQRGGEETLSFLMEGWETQLERLDPGRGEAETNMFIVWSKI